MDSLKLLESTGPPYRPARVAAVPAQRPPPPQTAISRRPVDTILIAGPDGTVNEALRTALSRAGAHRIVRAGSAPAVRDLLDRGVTGDLALVSARFGSHTYPLIRALRGGGWPRVIVCTPTGLLHWCSARSWPGPPGCSPRPAPTTTRAWTPPCPPP